jgi:hypothetical protein
MASKTSIKSRKAAAKRVDAKAVKPRKTAPKTGLKTALKIAPKSRSRRIATPALLSGGNPQIAKADGDAPVQAYIAAMPGWKRDLGRGLDALIMRTVPGVRKAVKWNSPLYGIEAKAGSSAFIASRTTSKWLSSAERHCIPFPPAAPRARTRAISTSVRATSSTNLSLPLG